MSSKPEQLTGRKVLLIAAAAFGVILAANLTMLLAATGTFPGLVVKNSYIASQGWDRRIEAQRALGWTAVVVYGDETLQVKVTGRDGAPVTGLKVITVIGLPASDAADMRLELSEAADGYAAPLILMPGRWRIMITGTSASGDEFAATAALRIGKPA